jgi:hypothetical protein
VINPGVADPPGNPATVSVSFGFRSVALRPTLSHGLPLSDVVSCLSTVASCVPK